MPQLPRSFATVILVALSVGCGSGGSGGASGDGPANRADAAGPDDAGTNGVPGATETKPDAEPPHLDAQATDGASQAGDAGEGERDWSAHPAIVSVNATSTLYAVSDIHGGYDRLAALLTANGVIGHLPAQPSAAQWAAGASVLVVVGDLIDKGPSPLEVLDFLIALQLDAASHGGQVIVTLGNHEAEFFADPNNTKASGPDGIDVELSAKGIAPADVAAGREPRGHWLRELPFGAVVGNWFFSHAGDTGGSTVAALEAKLRTAVQAHPDYNDPQIVGASSLLESRSWYTAATTVTQDANALGVAHIVFGHDPKALGPRGSIAFVQNGALVRIDCGLSPLVNDSTGKLLRVRHAGATDIAEELDASGAVVALFSSP